MNFKQNSNGIIEASFMPSEIATLVRIVESSELARIEGIKNEAAKVIVEASKARQFIEKESVTPTKPE